MAKSWYLAGRSFITENISWGHAGPGTFPPSSFPILPMNSLQPWSSSVGLKQRQPARCGLCIRISIFIYFFIPETKHLIEIGERGKIYSAHGVIGFSLSSFGFRCLTVLPSLYGSLRRCFWSCKARSRENREGHRSQHKIQLLMIVTWPTVYAEAPIFDLSSFPKSSIASWAHQRIDQLNWSICLWHIRSHEIELSCPEGVLQ